MDIEFMFLLECVLLQQQLQILSRTVTVKPKGRPLKYITEKERKDAIKNGRKNGRKNGKKDARNNKRENICQ
jgi:hypothetical protein